MRSSPHITPLGRRATRGRRRSVRVHIKALAYWIVHRHAWLAMGAFGYAVASSAFSNPLEMDLSHGIAISSLLGLVTLRVAARFGPPLGPAVPADDRTSPLARQEDLNLGLLLVVSFHVLFQLTGGQDSPYYPLTYLFIAFASAFAERSAGAVILLACLGAEGLAAYAAGLTPRTGAIAAQHGAFVLVFSVAWWSFLKGQVVFHRRQQQQALDDQLERTLEEARDFKLIASPLTRDSRTRPRAEEERLQLKQAVDGIQGTVRSSLNLLRDAYSLHTCALYWQGSDGRLRLRDAVSASKVFDGRTLDVKEGLPGAAFTQRQPLRQHELRPDDPRLAYYQPGEHVFSVQATPIFQGRFARGVLVGDRKVRLPFTDANEAVFVSVAKLITNAVDNERVFLDTERAKDAQERFHRGLKALNSAQEVGDVHDAVFSSIRHIAPFDFGALTEFDEAAGWHRVVCVVGEGHDDLTGLEFEHGKGLVSQVTKGNVCLPITGRVEKGRRFVFTEEAGPDDMRSLVVMPLSFGHRAVGTLTLACEAAGAYPADVRDRLEVVISAASQSLVNANNFQKIRDLATTDPLTGLVNRRVLMRRFEEMSARARRSKGPLSLLLCDLDHFKAVNDTFGHSAGDDVLKAAAHALLSCVRTTDVVARYGGEEFAVLLEDADPIACMTVAENIRTAVAKIRILTEAREIRPTTSVGCATWEASESGPFTAELLIDQADKALYRAKDQGRNRSIHFGDSPVVEPVC